MTNKEWMEWVFSLGKEYSNNERLVLLLITYGMDSNGRIELSNNQAIEQTGIKTPEAISNSIERLEAKKIVRIVQAGGGRGSYVYQFNLSALLPAPTPPENRGGMENHPPRKQGGSENSPPRNPHPLGVKEPPTSEESRRNPALVFLNKNITNNFSSNTYAEVLETLRRNKKYPLSKAQELNLVAWLQEKKISAEIAETVAIQFTGFFLDYKTVKGKKQEFWCYTDNGGTKKGYYSDLYSTFQNWCKQEVKNSLVQRQKPIPQNNNGSIKDATHFAQLAQERKR